MRLPDLKRRLAITGADVAGHCCHEQIVARLGVDLALGGKERSGMLGHARRIARRHCAEEGKPAALEIVQAGKAAPRLRA